ncbi:Sortase A [Streptococcus parauberis]|uniref:Sortase A, LPXTG specific n=1 Tax=Streptococcus parauberis KRS-02083 TaxID=1207545 RepID=A0ABN0ISW0_9STRE|nr:sortase [Streptococcus parauberis]AUT06026.1 Sortase A [Streptococcus parauberis]EMG25928.1 Sortase A, LPXTG specific [Streptococcus parauberis KRS-02083]PNY21326.1 Sortase family protein [Streptococcus parauberis]UWV09435.1 sortase [Streptococcus parauberis]WEM62224.1 sortase [Streptococcus parauberis]
MARKKKSNIGDRIRIVLAITLLIVGLGLLFNKTIRNTMIAWNSNKYQVSRVSKKTIKKNKEAKTSFDFAGVNAVDTQTVVEAQMAAQKLPVIGGIAVPDVNINLPIFKGLGNVELLYGAGTMKDGQIMGGENNYSLASHHIFGMVGSSKMLFSPLENAKIGMPIYVTDKEKIYRYDINSVNRVTPDRVDVINDTPGSKDITLITCTDAEATERIVVKGLLKEEMTYKGAPEKILNYFSKSYNQVAIE